MANIWLMCIYIYILLIMSIVMGVLQARWLVYFMENPNPKWMITRGTPIYGKPHVSHGPAIFR